jgi:hypothetical protein
LVGRVSPSFLQARIVRFQAMEDSTCYPANHDEADMQTSKKSLQPMSACLAVGNTR